MIPQILKCIQKQRKYGTIAGYELIDLNNNKITIDRDSLKYAIVMKKVFVVNLKLTSDNKLIDYEYKIDNIIKYIKYYYKVIAFPNNSMVECSLNFDSDEVSISKILLKSNELIIPDCITGVKYDLKIEQYVKIDKLRVVHKNNRMTSMRGLFYNLGVEEIDLSLFNTQGVKDFSQMFFLCRARRIIFGEHFDTSSAITLDSMFLSMTNITELSLRGFNVNNVKYMGSMFEDCTNIKSIDITGWNTSRVISMISMFNKCKNLIEIQGLSEIRADSLRDMSYMFSECEKLEFISLRGMNTDKIRNMEFAFYKCTGLHGINLCNIELRNDTMLHAVAYKCCIEDKIIEQLRGGKQ